MKQIICPECHDVLWTKKNKSLTLGVYSSGNHPMVIKCSRCTSSFKMYPADFARMPEVVK